MTEVVSGEQPELCNMQSSGQIVTINKPTPSFFLQAGCPSCCPANSARALKGSCIETCPIQNMHSVILYFLQSTLACIVGDHYCLVVAVAVCIYLYAKFLSEEILRIPLCVCARDDWYYIYTGEYVCTVYYYLLLIVISSLLLLL